MITMKIDKIDNLSFISNVTIIEGTKTREIYFFHFIFWGIILPIIVLFGLIGNILTIIVLWRKEMHSTTVFYLRALVVTDTAILVLAFITLTPLSLSNYTKTLEKFKEIVYPIIFTPCNYMVMTVQAINVWITVSVTIERYIAICHPFTSVRLLTRRKALVVIGTITILSILYNLPRLFATEAIKNEENGYYNLLETNFGITNLYMQVYRQFMYSLLIFIIPLSVLVVLNGLLIIELMRRRRRRIGMNIKEDNETNISRTLVLIVVIFIVCQTPGLIVQYNILFERVLLKWLAISNTLFVLNSSVNFLVYMFVGRKFRKVLLRTFRPMLLKTLGACRLELSEEQETRTSIINDHHELTTMNDQLNETESIRITTP